MKKIIGFCIVGILIFGLETSYAKKLPVAEKGGKEVNTLDVKTVEGYFQGNTGAKLKNWYTFDIGKKETFTFTNNDNGIVNKVTSKKRSNLQGVLESKLSDGKYGGNVTLINPNGITLKKGFSYKGFKLGLYTNENMDSGIHYSCLKKITGGASIGQGNKPETGSLEAHDSQEFRIAKGSLRLNKKGVVSGSGEIVIGENNSFIAKSAAGERLRMGSISVGANSTVALFGENISVRDMTATGDASFMLSAQKKLFLRGFTGNEATLALGGVNIRSSKAIVADKLYAFDEYTNSTTGISLKSAPPKLVLAKGTQADAYIGSNTARTLNLDKRTTWIDGVEKTRTNRVRRSNRNSLGIPTWYGSNLTGLESSFGRDSASIKTSYGW
ncbi:MAG: filamentous hemagglutinin N-terminal domain-containing protein [Planctomycetia bacterium]|nr:filamentous hemagglutinin N-terminal domain-containing protein [Planctomycetia bacterium]